MKKHSETISPAGLSKWKEAVAEYTSQHLYPTSEITDKKIIEYWSRTNGIFLWERQSVEQIFTKIYYENQWKDADTASGPGSSLEETAVIRRELPEIIKACGANSIFDFPCGDFFWMRLVELGINYMGADIVRELVAGNQTHYGSPTRRFVYANLLEAPLPVADLFLCRDCLAHFSWADVQRALRNIRSSGCKYLLTTTFPEARGDWDIETGWWRPINLQASPYFFPPPINLIDEKISIQYYGPKCLGLWSINDIPEMP
jgi:SAM-dependent methyltransferase